MYRVLRYLHWQLEALVGKVVVSLLHADELYYASSSRWCAGGCLLDRLATQ